jgi:hypothetical protein
MMVGVRPVRGASLAKAESHLSGKAVAPADGLRGSDAEFAGDVLVLPSLRHPQDDAGSLDQTGSNERPRAHCSSGSCCLEFSVTGRAMRMRCCAPMAEMQSTIIMVITYDARHYQGPATPYPTHAF